MQRIDNSIRKDIVDEITDRLTYFDQADAYTTFVWRGQLSGESNLFRGLARASNSID